MTRYRSDLRIFFVHRFSVFIVLFVEWTFSSISAQTWQTVSALKTELKLNFHSSVPSKTDQQGTLQWVVSRVTKWHAQVKRSLQLCLHQTTTHAPAQQRGASAEQDETVKPRWFVKLAQQDERHASLCSLSGSNNRTKLPVSPTLNAVIRLLHFFVQLGKA